jgi:hypothetical protein
MSCYQPGLLLFELIFKNLWEKNWIHSIYIQFVKEL